MAVIFTIILKLLIITGVVTTAINSTVGAIVLNMLQLVIQFNVVFGIFNLMPIPPFDGSRILYYFLPQKGREIMYNTCNWYWFNDCKSNYKFCTLAS